jgi:hypothetical protein
MTEEGKKKMKKEKDNFDLEYARVSYNWYLIQTRIYKVKQKYYCNYRNTSTSVLFIFISMGYFHETILF